MYDIFWLVLSVLVICGLMVLLSLPGKRPRKTLPEPLPPGMTKVDIREIARKGGSTYERILLDRHGITGEYQVINARQYRNRLDISVYYRGSYFVFCFFPEGKCWSFLAEVTSDPTGRIRIRRDRVFLAEKARQQLPDITRPQGIILLQKAIDCPAFVSQSVIQNTLMAYDEALRRKPVRLIVSTG